MLTKRMNMTLFSSLVLWIFSSSAQAAFHNSLYSESTYYESYDVVTESRLKSLFIWEEGENMSAGAYVGASIQYQTPNAPQKYYDNALTPQAGLQFGFLKKITLQLQAGYRNVIEEKSQATSESEWDPRAILSAGDFLYWSPSSPLFTEYYGEASYVPRLSSTPVSSAWLKAGMRYSPLKNIYADPYAEGFIRESRSPDLGPSMTQWRVGGRLLWTTTEWNVAALLYHNINSNETSSPIEGLFVVGGNF
ncbi:hypothetical protein [Bdellovibrio sp. HCB2-146]|uniref:hypothetical protein n=1 Tax=Bdellovibrio sp. HCB2-146 TaxID=3394362 RepID=UPI0039BD8BD0